MIRSVTISTGSIRLPWSIHTRGEAIISLIQVIVCAVTKSDIRRIAVSPRV